MRKASVLKTDDRKVMGVRIPHPPPKKCWGLAQLVERRTLDPKVSGSNPESLANLGL